MGIVSEERVEMSNDWRLWDYFPPPYGILLQFWRKEWKDSTHVSFREDLSPEMHIGDLYWRLTGIGKHQLEAIK